MELTQNEMTLVTLTAGAVLTFGGALGQFSIQSCSTKSQRADDRKNELEDDRRAKLEAALLGNIDQQADVRRLLRGESDLTPAVEAQLHVAGEEIDRQTFLIPERLAALGRISTRRTDDAHLDLPTKMGLGRSRSDRDAGRVQERRRRRLLTARGRGNEGSAQQHLLA